MTCLTHEGTYDPTNPDGPCVACQEIERLALKLHNGTEALELIAKGGCERVTTGNCKDAGYHKGDRYADHAWCMPCIAQEALDE